MVWNVPLNNRIDRADPAADNAALWAYYCAHWTRWNHVRTLASLAAAGLFIGGARRLEPRLPSAGRKRDALRPLRRASRRRARRARSARARCRAGLERGAVAVEPPRDPAHGDLATNAAMVLAKPAGHQPARAGRGDRRRSSAALDEVDERRDRRAGLHQPAARPPASGATSCARSSRDGARLWPLGAWAAGRRSTSNMSRPTRPGRCTWAIAAARWSATRWPALLEFAGHQVTREYYVNDAGGAGRRRSPARRTCATARRSARTIGEIPEGLYPGDYLMPVGAGARRRIRRPLSSARPRANGWPCSASERSRR